MLSILRRSVLPASRGLIPVRALSTAAPLYEAAARQRGRPKGSVNQPKAIAGDAAAPKGPKAPKAPKATKPKAPKKAVKPKKPKIADEDHPPKRPMSAYARFFKEWFDANKDSLRENGKLDITSMSRAIGQAWSDLQTSDPARVEELQAQTKAETAEFDKVYKEWFFERSLAERNVIEKATGRRLAFPGGRANFRRDLRHRPGNPGRPSSSFFEYLRSIQPELMEHPDVAGKRGIEGHQAAAKIAAERWRGLPEEEKAQWKKVAAERKVKFDEWFKTQEEAGPQK